MKAYATKIGNINPGKNTAYVNTINKLREIIEFFGGNYLFSGFKIPFGRNAWADFMTAPIAVFRKGASREITTPEDSCLVIVAGCFIYS